MCADKVKTDAEIVEHLRSTRLGPNATCQNCKHCYPMRQNPTDLTTKKICAQAPPVFQFIHTGNDRHGNAIVSVQQVHRVVSDDFFCGCFEPDVGMLS